MTIIVSGGGIKLRTAAYTKEPNILKTNYKASVSLYMLWSASIDYRTQNSAGGKAGTKRSGPVTQPITEFYLR